jgi:predicted transcriptional regulator
MSNRLQVLIPPDLDARLDKAAQRVRISKGEWVRRAIEESLRRGSKRGAADPVARLASLGAPVGDIASMLKEIETGRR